ncbi:MAG: HEAT repeat domain-containing protein, partial [Armatimonadota bacterium]|nr:HEAT repeat domain-containing protein [Armatimonadota bacterium]
AAVALGHLGDGRALAPLTEALVHAESGVRYAAAAALASLGSVAVPALERLRHLLENDPDRSVRHICQEAIRRIQESVHERELVAGSPPAGTGTELERADSLPDLPAHLAASLEPSERDGVDAADAVRASESVDRACLP